MARVLGTTSARGRAMGQARDMSAKGRQRRKDRKSKRQAAHEMAVLENQHMMESALDSPDLLPSTPLNPEEEELF